MSPHRKWRFRHWALKSGPALGIKSMNTRREMRIRHHSPALIDPTPESVSKSSRCDLANFTDSSGTSRRVLLFVVCLMMLAATIPANALDPHQPPGGYLRRAFTVEDGLPDNQVNVIVGSPNGFLWIGTDAGLARFDGAHFAQIRFRSGVSREAQVTSMALMPDGSLWVGTVAGLIRIPKSGLDHFDRSLIATYHPGASLSDQITCLKVSHAGTLWVGTNRGLYKFDQGSFVPLLPQELISAVEEAANGNLLIVTGHGFVEWDGSRIMGYPELPPQLGVGAHEIYQVFDDRSGVRWYCTSAGIARSVNGSIYRLAPYGRSRMWQAAYRIYEDPQGNLWSTTFKGIFRASADRQEPVVADSRVTAMYSDVDGDLWIGTANSGLIRLKDRTIRMYTTSDGLPGDVVMSVLTSHDGTLWAGSNCGGLSRFDGQYFRTYNEKDGLSNSCVWSLAEDSWQNLWVGTWGGGLYRFRDGHFTQYSTSQGLPSVVVLSIVAAHDGSLWIATAEGLSHMVKGTFHNYTTADGLSSDRVNSVFQDHTGGIWAGTVSGVDHLVGERFVPISTGPEMDNVLYGPLLEDSTGNLYALSLANGISRIDGDRLIHLSEAIEASGMVESDHHDLWFSGRNGVFRVAAGELKRQESDHGSPLDVTTFGLADGMISKECSEGQPNIAITPDGKVWIGTLKGLAMLDLRRILHRSRQPAIFMEEVSVGQVRRAAGSELILSPGKEHVELHFTAIDLASPENIHIQYRLDGVDSTWLDADVSRTAIYTDIPVGVHSFHIRATNGDGVWDRTGITYNINQRPFFYETLGFRLGALTAGFFVLAGLYQLRLRQAAARLNAVFNERLSERNRLAGELHDTILQTVQATKMIADNARFSHSEDPRHLREAIDSISKWLAQATTEARAALNAIRTSASQQDDLAEAFRQAAEASRGTSRMQFTLSVQGAAPQLDPIVRDEIYRVGCEAIRNAYLHSEASELTVFLSYTPNLTLRVQDNGRGIDPNFAAIGKPGHFGLRGMQERVERIHGTLRVMSRANSGTEVEVVVPAKAVFRGMNGGGRWWYSDLRTLIHGRADSLKRSAGDSKREKSNE